MRSKQERAKRITELLNRLQRGEAVTNQQLRSLLSAEQYKHYLDERLQQRELCQTLREKPDAIVEYERRLSRATFAYNKADAASRRGRREAATKLFARADSEFEKLAEYISENITGDAALECWLDRPVHYDANNGPNSSSDDFPCVVTSRSSRNRGGGLLARKCTIRRLKIDALEREIQSLEIDSRTEESDELVASRLAFGRHLRKLLEA